MTCSLACFRRSSHPPMHTQRARSQRPPGASLAQCTFAHWVGPLSLLLPVRFMRASEHCIVSKRGHTLRAQQNDASWRTLVHATLVHAILDACTKNFAHSFRLHNLRRPINSHELANYYCCYRRGNMIIRCSCIPFVPTTQFKCL